MGFPLSPTFFTQTITLQAQSVTQDASGGPVRAWADQPGTGPLAASIQPLSAHARAVFATRYLDVTHEIFTLVDPAFLRGKRVADGQGRHYAVHGCLDEASQGRLWVTHATEVLA